MTPTSSIPVTQSALDFDGLGKLRAQARQDETQAVRETAQQFEGVFIQMMMKSMRESVDKSDMSESNGQETFESMFDREVSHQMSKRNSLGLADMLVRDHEQRSKMVSSADALQGRDNLTPSVRALNAPETGLPLKANASNAYALPAAPGLRPLPSLVAPLVAPTEATTATPKASSGNTLGAER